MSVVEGDTDTAGRDRRRRVRRYLLIGLGRFGCVAGAWAVAIGLLAATGFPDTGPVSDIAAVLVGGSSYVALLALLPLAYSMWLSHAIEKSARAGADRVLASWIRGQRPPLGSRSSAGTSPRVRVRVYRRHRQAVVWIGWSTLAILFAGVIAGSITVFDLGGSVTLIVVVALLALVILGVTRPVIVATEEILTFYQYPSFRHIPSDAVDSLTLMMQNGRHRIVVGAFAGSMTLDRVIAARSSHAAFADLARLLGQVRPAARSAGRPPVPSRSGGSGAATDRSRPRRMIAVGELRVPSSVGGRQAGRRARHVFGGMDTRPASASGRPSRAHVHHRGHRNDIRAAALAHHVFQTHRPLQRAGRLGISGAPPFP